ncbi:hypothetical protein ACFQL1_15950 [Halomicroarcula sp. GCM10025709]|uniref:hypothetical protein n=1 Tax=Haloarcula TaxID=2237 RepID=UPI0024C25B8A|nr:hypothetical protein [Halomicroarcula sp. YJ-61-S]
MTPPYFDYAIKTGVTSSPGTQTVDDFEDNDLAEYQGDTGVASTQSGVVKDGSYALELSGDPDGSTKPKFPTIKSYSGLPTYPEKGDTIEIWVRIENAGVDAQVWFGVQSGSSNSYNALLRDDVEDIAIFKRGENTVLDSDPVTISTETWYRMKIQWKSNSDIIYELFDTSGSNLATAAAQDGTFSSGGVGFQTNSGGGDSGLDTVSAYYDSYALI